MAFLLCALLLAACAPRPAEQQRTLYLFGTLLEISAYTDDPAGFQAAVDQLEQRFQRMHEDWHAWKGEGELVRLNRALARGEPFPLSEELANLLLLGQAYSVQSEGLFNPALGRLIGLWGFHNDELPAGPPPSVESIRELVAALPSMDDLLFDGYQLSSQNPQVQLDLGAFAKGYALNLAIDGLKAQGIRHAIVNAGGDLCASGRHGERPWRIGIRHPQGSGVIASLELKGDECVLTSGNYERYREFEGIRYAHILDPRTGYPVEHVASATVISRDATLADAAATALSVAGPEAWGRIAQRMSMDQVMLVDEAGRVYLTPAMQVRVRFEAEVAEVIVPER
ncbi:MAG: FAD:protein FMN transferase [Pseudomonadota bacterium]